VPEPHLDQFPSGTWAPTTARLNPRYRSSSGVDMPTMPPDEVRATVERWGNWKPEEARWLADTVPFRIRKGEGSIGLFYPAEKPWVEVGDTAGDLTIEHEGRHAWDRVRGALPSGYDPSAVQADYSALAHDARPEYGQAAQTAQSILSSPDPAVSGDPVHFGHQLIHRLYYDYNRVPPEHRQKYFGQGDTSQRGHLDDYTPAINYPIATATPTPSPTPTRYRTYLPSIPRAYTPPQP
jgi:hypothetical protein